jgi:hypothetical protein
MWLKKRNGYSQKGSYKKGSLKKEVHGWGACKEGVKTRNRGMQNE